MWQMSLSIASIMNRKRHLIIIVLIAFNSSLFVCLMPFVVISSEMKVGTNMTSTYTLVFHVVYRRKVGVRAPTNTYL